MGYGSYSSIDWAKLKHSRDISSGSVNTIFTSRSLDPKYDPQFVNMRESRDSDDHPDSTPIIIGVDVTGSMGYLSESIIKNSLNELMMKLYSTELVKDPQLMFSAIGDVKDKAPLQITQFESDIRIAEQLMDLWIENRGGDADEDYELLWYFAANHTDTDSFKKRGKKGFCFTIGDAGCHENLTKDSIKHIFDDSVHNDFSSKAIADSASETYELFHIMIGSDIDNFSAILPGRVAVIDKNDIDYLPEIIISIIRFTNGVSLDDIIKDLSTSSAALVKKSLSFIKAADNDMIVF